MFSCCVFRNLSLIPLSRSSIVSILSLSLTLTLSSLVKHFSDWLVWVHADVTRPPPGSDLADVSGVEENVNS